LLDGPTEGKAMVASQTIKRERIDGTNGIHSSFKAILDNIGDKTPNQKQIVTIVGTLTVLKAHANKAGKFSGELGETNRLALEQLIERCAALKPDDPQAWDQTKEAVQAAWIVLRSM